jgi:hypothetical protein
MPEGQAGQYRGWADGYLCGRPVRGSPAAGPACRADHSGTAPLLCAQRPHRRPADSRVRSVIDYVVRRLAIDWLSYPDRASLGVFTIDERMAAARTWLDTEDMRMSRRRGDAGMGAFRWEIATGTGVPAIS